ncbi:tetratricopeptide repeat protein [Aliiglaciecola aliphaticivorans]
MNTNPHTKTNNFFIRNTFFIILLSVFSGLSNAQQMGGNSSDSAFVEASTQIGVAFAGALNDQDIDSLGEMTDVKHLGQIVGKTLFSKPREVNDFVRGFSGENTRKTLINNLFMQFFIEESNSKFVRMLEEQGAQRPLIRIDYATGGHEYLILFINDDNKVFDFHIASKGTEFSDSLTQATALMISTDDSFFGKMFGKEKVNEEVMSQFQRIGSLRQSGQFVEAYKLLLSMPEEMKKQRVIIDTGIGLAQNINDEEYLAQLSMLDKYYGHLPSTQFMLLDYYVMTENNIKTIRAMENVIKRFGMDGALGELTANLYYNVGNLSEALKYAYLGVNAEPSFEPPYWTLLTIYNEQQNYQGVADTLDLISERLYYEFTPESLGSEPAFAGFLASDAYKLWLQN